MDNVENALYLILLAFATYGAILLLGRRKPPPEWKVETLEEKKDRKQDPFRNDKPDSFLKR
jgi:hypothetical protein